jgi:hypothetical protein
MRHRRTVALRILTSPHDRRYLRSWSDVRRTVGANDMQQAQSWYKQGLASIEAQVERKLVEHMLRALALLVVVSAVGRSRGRERAKTHRRPRQTPVFPSKLAPGAPSIEAH